MTRYTMLALSLFTATTIITAAEPVTLSRDITKITADALALVGPAEDAPKELRIKPRDKVAFMGDSITAGGGYVRLAAAVIRDKYPDHKLPSFVNAGVSGQKAENMAARFENSMQLTNKPAWTFINVGINDVWHRLKDPHDPAILGAYEDGREGADCRRHRGPADAHRDSGATER
jgi:lysophospholipase L1-like esterase